MAGDPRRTAALSTSVAPAGGSTRQREGRRPVAVRVPRRRSVFGQVVDVFVSPQRRAPAFRGSVWFVGWRRIVECRHERPGSCGSHCLMTGTDARACRPDPGRPRRRPRPASGPWPPPPAGLQPGPGGRRGPGRGGSFGLEDGPAQLARWFATVTPAPSLRPDTCLPVGPWTIVNREHRGSEGKPRGVTWEGFFNARDLGGPPTGDARVSDCGALLRSADPRFVTEAGWRAAPDAGVRTVIDLRCGECRGRRSRSSLTPQAAAQRCWV
jgi:hypothetical protein